MTVQQLVVPPPLLGLNKRAAYSMVDPGYTVDSLNVWPYDWIDSGRQKIGTRPGISAAGNNYGGGAPYGWCEISYYNSGVKIGIAVTGASGTFYTLNGSSWSPASIGSPGNDFASCACYLQYLFQARGGGTCTWKKLGVSPLDGTGEGSGDLNSGNSEDPDSAVAPTNCGIVQRWGDRLVLAGDTDHPHSVYMSRIGDPFDWDYTTVDRSSPVVLSGTGGIIGEPVTSLIPHNQQCLLVGCTDSIYVVRGNPKGGGVIEELSHAVGPLMQTAWCKDGEDNTWMLTRDGLYKMPPGCGAPPTRVSRQVLPEALVGITPGDHFSGSRTDKASLVYDNRFNGIHIFVDFSTGSDAAYFYDLANGGFWEQSYPSTIQMGATLKSFSSSTRSPCIFFSSTTTYNMDEGDTPSDSRLYYGPIAIGSPHNEGLLTSVDFVMGHGSEDIEWSVYAGHSPQEAYENAVDYTGEDMAATGGGGTTSQSRHHPRVRGNAAFIRLDDAGGSQWSMEEVAIEVAQVGRKRV